MLTSVQYEVLFRVTAETGPGEVVCVTGEGSQLGNWDPTKALKLKLEKEKNVWSRQKSFSIRQENLKYRYFVAQVFQTDNEEGEESVIVSQWETNIKPRSINFADYGKKENNGLTAVFGEYDNLRNVTSGWLTDQSHISICLHANPIKIWNTKYRDQTYSIKCSPIDHRYRDEHSDEDGETLPNASNSLVRVSVLDKGRSVPCLQGEHGATYIPSCYMIFMVQTHEPENTGFQLDFYVHDAAPDCSDNDPPPRHVGYSFILPLDMHRSTDKKTVPITSLKHKPLGQVTFDYLLIKPMISQKYTLEVSYQNYWKSTRQPLDIGHRGMGVSFSANCKMLATVPENTVQSLMDAASHGADMVELDVHLSKDRRVIIYHDFRVKITYKKKKQGELELLEIPIKDLKLSELQHMKLWHKPRPDDLGEINHDDLDPEDLQPFPTLQRCMQAVDLHTGFNIEIKYPQRFKNGTHEQEHYYDLNEFIDTILREVFQNHAGRRIIFSTFDCDTCIALRLKQNKFPVLFLTQGNTTAYDSYHDARTQSVKMGAEFCLAYNILGVNAMSELLLNDMSLIDYVIDSGLVLFTWGEDNNNSENIKKLKQSRVHAIIYDRIDHFKSSGKEESVFKMEHKAKMQFFQKRASQNGECSNGKPLIINMSGSGSEVE